MTGPNQAESFLTDLAQAIHSILEAHDPDGAIAISTALIVVRSVIERNNVLINQMAACLQGSIVDGRLREDEAIALLMAWKQVQKMQGVTWTS